MSSYCVICRKSFARSNVKLIRVPKDLERKTIWEESVGMKIRENTRVCEYHFEPIDWKDKAAKRRQLMPNAVPKKIVIREAESSSSDSKYKDCGSQTESEVIQSGVLLENFRMKREMLELKKETANVRKELEKMNTFMASIKGIFTETQLEKLKNGDKRANWKWTDISYGICLHNASTQVYRHLYNKGFPLPSLSTLKRSFRNMPLDSGTLDFVIELMARSFELSDDEKVCVLLFDKMKVASSHVNESSADAEQLSHNYVQVAMAAGLKKPWKQPVFFDFDRQMDATILNEIICKLQIAGYPVVGVICNLSPANLKLWRELGISENKSWFDNPANPELKIYVFANVPDLIALVRSHFVDTGLVVNGSLLKPQSVKQVINLASSSDLSISLPVTEEHLNARCTGRQNLKLVTQLFSNETVAAFRHCHSLGLDVKNPCNIADFFQAMHEWFEVFNTKLSTAGIPASTQPFGKQLAEQQSILTNMSHIMRENILPDGEKCAPFQEAIIICNNSLIGLYDHLSEKYDMEYILTYRLNQEVLDNWFGSMRGENEPDHPNPTEFIERLRKHLLSTQY